MVFRLQDLPKLNSYLGDLFDENISSFKKARAMAGISQEAEGNSGGRFKQIPLNSER